ncbi:DNA-directed RNA polymerase subunit [Striga asiatica]|uniref:DNA-directed RNA polymerase subunit n=1 Tax=Striga asiatica TaxID=4170 RepID=A0A5A7PUV2_STRAF|nr:DNA-directed RNA polymerase subunit [Striga asiatica]
MQFCPTCGTMLLFELAHMAHPNQFFCPTCPYVCRVENKIKQHTPLVRKPMEPIFSEDDQKVINKTSGVSCPACGHGEASYIEVQTRSADEPMTIFYRCTKCKSTWKEN